MEKGGSKMIRDKTKKLCPLASTTREPFSFMQCVEGRCAWWNPAAEECSIRSIGTAMWRRDVK